MTILIPWKAEKNWKVVFSSCHWNELFRNMKIKMRPWKPRKQSSPPAATHMILFTKRFTELWKIFFYEYYLTKSIKKIKEMTVMKGWRKWEKDFSSLSALQVDPCAPSFWNASKVWRWKEKKMLLVYCLSIPWWIWLVGFSVHNKQIFVQILLATSKFFLSEFSSFLSI